MHVHLWSSRQSVHLVPRDCTKTARVFAHVPSYELRTTVKDDTDLSRQNAKCHCHKADGERKGQAARRGAVLALTT